MNKQLIALTCLSLAFALGAEEGRFEVVGAVEPDSVVAVPLTLDVYRACGAGEGRLERELRVCDAKGVAQPYVIRRRFRMKTHKSRRQLECAIRDLTKNEDGTVTMLVERGECAGGIAALQIGTPLKDFAQVVSVADAEDSGKRLSEGRIYDYTRYAPVRSVEIPVAADLPRKFRLTFRQPVTEVERAEFERIVQKGAAASETIRRTVVEQSFRVDSVRIGYDVETVSREPLEAEEIRLPGGPDGKDAFAYETFSAPVSAIAAPGSSNWEFDVVVGDRRTPLSAFNLPGKRTDQRRFAVKANPVDGMFRFKVDWKGSASVALGDPAFGFELERREVVFVAGEGGPYHIAFERGGESPRYPAVVREYLQGCNDFKVCELESVGSFAAPKTSPLAAWFKRNWVSVTGGIALVVLLFFCISAFGKSTRMQ